MSLNSCRCLGSRLLTFSRSDQIAVKPSEQMSLHDDFFSKLSLSFATWKRNSSCVLVDNRKHNKPNYNNNHVQMQNCAPTLE